MVEWENWPWDGGVWVGGMGNRMEVIDQEGWTMG